MSSSPVQENGGAYADTDAFAGLVFAISGKFTESHAAISSLIRRNAGDIKASVTKAVLLPFSSATGRAPFLGLVLQQLGSFFICSFFYLFPGHPPGVDPGRLQQQVH